MILTETEIKKLVASNGHTTPATYDDAVQEATIAVFTAEREKPGNRQHAIGRAISAARNFTRHERTYQKQLGGDKAISGLSIHDERTANILVAPEDNGFTPGQVKALYAFLATTDIETRSVVTRYLEGEKMDRIADGMLISHTQVSRIIRRFKEAAAHRIGEVE